MYELAVPYFPENGKLLKKISDLKDKDKNTTVKTEMRNPSGPALSLNTTNKKSSSYSSVRQEVFVTEETFAQAPAPVPRQKPKRTFAVFSDIGNDVQRQLAPRSPLAAAEMEEDTASEYEDDGNEEEEWSPNTQQTPRTKNLLRIITRRMFRR